MDALVSTEWLERELGASDLRVVDATKFMAGTDRDARAEYEAGHIPGAVPTRRAWSKIWHRRPKNSQAACSRSASATAAGS